MHEEYGHSAFFGIYIRVPLNGEVLFLPGSLLLSLQYFLEKRPLLMLIRNNENLLKLNHSFVDKDGMVLTDYLRNWNQNSTFEEALNDVVDKLQGDPFNLLVEDPQVENATEETEEPEKPISVDVAPSFNPNIRWEDITLPEATLGAGSFAVVKKG